MSPITIQIPDYLRKQVEQLAAKEGLSVDQFFATAASEKLAVMEAVDYIGERAARASDAAFDEVVSRIPAAPLKGKWDEPASSSGAER